MSSKNSKLNSLRKWNYQQITSKHLKYLKEKKLIHIRTSQKDHRSYTISLTPLADTILENIYNGQRENAKLGLSVLTSTEAEQFSRISAKITAALDSDDLKTI